MITFPSNTKNIINDIRSAIGRNVTFINIASQEICPVCGLDPVTNTAIDAFCPVCSGEGYIYTYSGTTVSGHVTWGYSELLDWRTGGQLDAGDVRVQIEYTPINVTIIDSAVWVEVDDKIMQVKRKILRGVPSINRILIDLMEKEKES